jgi:hypothetical protein
MVLTKLIIIVIIFEIIALADEEEIMEKVLKEISTKLDVIVKLLCSKRIEGKSSTDSILALENAGVERKLIAELTGSTLNSIRVTISNARKKDKKKGNKKNMKEEQGNGQSQT